MVPGGHILKVKLEKATFNLQAIATLILLHLDGNASLSQTETITATLSMLLEPGNSDQTSVIMGLGGESLLVKYHGVEIKGMIDRACCKACL